eukprot:7940711-Pyramimonas_sp.AAC.1
MLPEAHLNVFTKRDVPQRASSSGTCHGGQKQPRSLDVQRQGFGQFCESHQKPAQGNTRPPLDPSESRTDLCAPDRARKAHHYRTITLPPHTWAHLEKAPRRLSPPEMKLLQKGRSRRRIATN